jgi:hypothetical protein
MRLGGNHNLQPAKPGRNGCRDNLGSLPFSDAGSTMWTLINILYQEYCRAKLTEMRRVRR